jgi:type I restriction-modification system DNA methylase subunit
MAKRKATYRTNGDQPGHQGKAKANGANLGFEEKLWLTADKLRGHLDPAEYKHVVLGLVFLKYISDAFEERHTWLLREAALLEERLVDSARLERAIGDNLRRVGAGG